jgi:5'-3' exoribonuclease 2
MGIPALFRWLATKYPKVTAEVVEEMESLVNGLPVPVDWSRQNPNGIEFDNLYLDMNGIIHPCCHPEDKKPPATEDEMYIEVFRNNRRYSSTLIESSKWFDLVEFYTWR